MTLDQFFTALAGVQTQWFLITGTGKTNKGQRLLRTGPPCWCPLEATRNDVHPDAERIAPGAVLASDQLGLDREDGARIVAAADEWPLHDPALRARLLAVCQPTPAREPKTKDMLDHA